MWSLNKSLVAWRAATLSTLIVGNLTLLPQPARATFVDYNLEDVPAERLISNIERKEKAEPEKKATFEFQLGRLYAMMATKGKLEVAVMRPRLYSQQTTSKPKESGVAYQDVGFAGVGIICPDYRQYFAPMPSTKFADSAMHMSVWHYRQSLKLAPGNNDARIGLAWALEQVGETSQAIAIYRDLVAKRVEVDPESKNFRQWSEGTNRAYEAAGYLQKLLDPTRDQEEIKTLAALPKPDYELHVETPIVLPLKANLSLNQIMHPARVSFDLGMGRRTYKNWPTAQAGWLVYDRLDNGQIDTGRKMFGSYSWFVFWESGFDALAALDDNADGKLSGAELNHLAVWCDLNCDGISQLGEVMPLSSLEVTELSCQAEADSNGVLRSESGVTFASGEKRTTYDVILSH